MRELSIKETKEISLEILKYIADLCQQLNLKYFLMWGTLIGAVRHKGFIPWDDDIDIMLPREDFNQLIRYLMENKEEIQPYELYSKYNKEDYFYSVSRLVDTRTVILGERKPTTKQCDCGVFVDIYPLENSGNTREEAEKFFTKQKKIEWKKFLAIDNYKPARSSLINSIGKIPISIYAHLCGYKKFDAELENRANVLSKESTAYVSCWAGWNSPHTGTFNHEWFEKLIEVPFEQYCFLIPACYEEILSQVYGNYMEYPPIEKQVGHHEYTAYMK